MEKRAGISGGGIYYVRRAYKTGRIRDGGTVYGGGGGGGGGDREGVRKKFSGETEGRNAATNARYHSGASDRLYARKMGLVFIEIAASRALLREARLYV